MGSAQDTRLGVGQVKPEQVPVAQVAMISTAPTTYLQQALSMEQEASYLEGRHQKQHTRVGLRRSLRPAGGLEQGQHVGTGQRVSIPFRLAVLDEGALLQAL